MTSWEASISRRLGSLCKRYLGLDCRFGTEVLQESSRTQTSFHRERDTRARTPPHEDGEPERRGQAGQRESKSVLQAVRREREGDFVRAGTHDTAKEISIDRQRPAFPAILGSPPTPVKPFRNDQELSARCCRLHHQTTGAVHNEDGLSWRARKLSRLIDQSAPFEKRRPDGRRARCRHCARQMPTDGREASGRRLRTNPVPFQRHLTPASRCVRRIVRIEHRRGHERHVPCRTASGLSARRGSGGSTLS